MLFDGFEPNLGDWGLVVWWVGVVVAVGGMVMVKLARRGVTVGLTAPNRSSCAGSARSIMSISLRMYTKAVRGYAISVDSI